MRVTWDANTHAEDTGQSDRHGTDPARWSERMQAEEEKKEEKEK